MSDHIEDEELKELLRSGVKIVSRKNGGAPEQKEVSDADKIISAIKSLGENISMIADRPAPDVNVAAPRVSVAAPGVTVSTPAAPRKWRVTVEERDRTADQRIKSLTIEAVD
jgi:hypothetical protein